MDINPALTLAIKALHDPAPKARSLILTAWGDTVFAFGGEVWLGSVVKLMQPLGLDERLVRTSIQRLIADEWLEARSHGKKRDIFMAGPRIEETRKVQQKIYHRQGPDWQGKWHLLIANPSSPAKRESLRRELTWLGYASLSPNQYIHPHDCWPMAQSRLAAKGLGKDISHRFEAVSLQAATPLVELWPLDQMRADWQQLGDAFTAINREIDHQLPDPATCFMLRTLAVHAIRRIILRDPDLPDHLLPGNWPAKQARDAFYRLWTKLRASADQFSAATLEGATADVSLDDAEYGRRFDDNP